MTSIDTKSGLKIIGTLLFLWGIFGYLFPQWRATLFTNNENLFHVITGLVAVMLAGVSPRWRTWTLVILALLYLALGVYGFTLQNPTDFHIRNMAAQLDTIDNYLHVIFALAFAWVWLNRKKPS